MGEQYIGIDLHQAFLQACTVTGTGARLWEERLPRTSAGREALVARCTPRTAMAVEASTPVWHFPDAVAGAVRASRVVDPYRAVRSARIGVTVLSPSPTVPSANEETKRLGVRRHSPLGDFRLGRSAQGYVAVRVASFLGTRYFSASVQFRTTASADAGMPVVSAF